ncbi:hypothetical protein GGR56DRAFT_646194 [Xylariaceae sp. FL0804]|nr:hypothetical protein GGR56DRAFT_646194 [Xylariaceae sp. FL0804]
MPDQPGDLTYNLYPRFHEHHQASQSHDANRKGHKYRQLMDGMRHAMRRLALAHVSCLPRNLQQWFTFPLRAAQQDYKPTLHTEYNLICDSHSIIRPIPKDSFYFSSSPPRESFRAHLRRLESSRGPRSPKGDVLPVSFLPSLSTWSTTYSTARSPAGSMQGSHANRHTRCCDFATAGRGDERRAGQEAARHSGAGGGGPAARATGPGSSGDGGQAEKMEQERRQVRFPYKDEKGGVEKKEPPKRRHCSLYLRLFLSGT